MKKALVIIDYQNDFVTGSLGFEKAKQIETSIIKKIESYLNETADLIFTLDTHDENYLNTKEGMYLPIPHCIADSEGWHIYGEVANFVDKANKIFKKSTFGSLELGQYLKLQNYDVVELAGIISNICVLSNAVIAKAALPNSKIIIDSNCIASNNEELHLKSLDIIKNLHIQVK